MKIVTARLNHETNTFSPVATPLASFGPDGPTFGAAALAAARGTRTALGAFIDAAAARGDEITVAVNATAYPSGIVERAAYEQLAGSIVAAVRAGCDAVALDLHGAMVAEGVDDGEGELLRRIRAVAPEVPLAVALDLHGNITQAMIDAAVHLGFPRHIAYELVTGKRPFQGSALSNVLYKILNETPAPPVCLRPGTNKARAGQSPLPSAPVSCHNSNRTDKKIRGIP